jgi:hypothetical protein
MGHPAVKNKTPFAVEVLFLADEEGRPLWVPLVQATYRIVGAGSLVLAEEPLPIKMAGEYFGDPDTASMKYEPACAFVKPATDVVLIGHAHARDSSTTQMQVGVQVGPVQKVVTVVGDRVLYRRGGTTKVTPAQPIGELPLVYERAFGGWDKRNPDARKHRFEPRNPVGTGFRDPTLEADDELKLPNLEDPQRPYRAFGDTPPPAGFGFIGPNWQPRAAFAGTYDAAWDKERKPLLPKDFDRRFFNAASPGLITPGYLRGDEPVVVVGASPQGRIAFHLPGIPAPVCHVVLRSGPRDPLQTALDTVIINMDEHLLILIWRAYVTVRNGPHDLVSAEIVSDVAVSAAGGV